MTTERCYTVRFTTRHILSVEIPFLADAQVLFFSVLHIDNFRFLLLFCTVRRSRKAVYQWSFGRCTWDTGYSFCTNANCHGRFPDILHHSNHSFLFCHHIYLILRINKYYFLHHSNKNSSTKMRCIRYVFSQY